MFCTPLCLGPAERASLSDDHSVVASSASQSRCGAGVRRYEHLQASHSLQRYGALNEVEQPDLRQSSATSTQNVEWERPVTPADWTCQSLSPAPHRTRAYQHTRSQLESTIAASGTLFRRASPPTEPRERHVQCACESCVRYVREVRLAAMEELQGLMSCSHDVSARYGRDD